MGNVYGVNYTKSLAAYMTYPMGPEWNGPVKAICDKYEAASLASGSVIYAGKLYAGEVFLIGWIWADDLSSAGTLALGDIGLTDGTDTGDPDRYLTATVFTTTGQLTACTRDIGFGYKTTVDRDFIITTATEEMTGTIGWLILKGGF
jgi:hypothetical protein